MRAVGDHQCRTISLTCIDNNAVTAFKSLVGVSSSSEVPDIFPIGIVLDNVVLAVPVYHIDIPISGVNGCLRRHELSWVFILAGFLRIVQLENLLSLQVGLDDLVAIGIRNKKELLIAFRTQGQAMA